MKWKARQGRECLAHRPLCKCVFKTNYHTAIRQLICWGTRPWTPASWAWLPCTHQAISLGMRGQFSVEDSWWKRGFLSKRTSFIFPSVSSHSTVWGQIRSCNILHGNLALSFYKLECRDGKGLVVTTWFTTKDRTEGNTTTHHLPLCKNPL